MNLADLIVILIAAFAAFRGWRRGLVGQIFELGGAFLGLIAGVLIGPRIAALFTKQAGIQAALISLLIVFILLSVGQAVGYIVGQRFGSLANRARLGDINSGLGSAFGIIITLVSFWLIGSLLILGPSPAVSRSLKHSKVLGWLNNQLPQPPDVLAYLRQYLDTSGFPQVFAGFPPSLGPPVKLPSSTIKNKAVRSAAHSTVRVVVAACGGEQLGSGWISAPQTIVTNAHVVAGGHSAAVVQDADGNHQGHVVLFDPKTDIAVIHLTDTLAGPTLSLDTAVLDRGASGATLGYPGDANGRLISHRAAVQAYYPDARGRDIYGRGQVNRAIYELRSVIRQGDSGGPFVLADGRVAGVDFAASTTDSETGYALTGGQVVGDVRRGASRSAPVATGPCTH